MSMNERLYLDPNQAQQLLHEFKKKQQPEQALQSESASVSPNAVRETGARASRAVEGLKIAYVGTPERAEEDRFEPGESGRFVQRKDKAGNVRFERVDPLAAEALDGQLKASMEQGQRLSEAYNRALTEVAQADEEIRALQQRQSRLGEWGRTSNDPLIAKDLRRISGEIEAWLNWRKARSEAVAQYSREFSQNNVRAETVRELKRSKEAQAELARLQKGHKELFQKSEIYWEALEENEEVLAKLRDQLAEAMARDAANVQLTNVARVPKTPKRDLWSFFRRFRGDGVEVQRPEYGQKTEPSSEVQALLRQIGEKNQKAEALTQAKEANDRRMNELAEQIQAIEQPSLRKAS